MLRVENWMKRDPITISPETGVLEASRLLRQYRIRHLPVVKGGFLVGILTDRDLKRVLPSTATSLSVYEVNYLLDRLEAREVMTKQVVTVLPEAAIDEAAKLLLAHKIGALPVVEEDKLVGILTETDVLEALVEAMSAQRSGFNAGAAVEVTPAPLRDMLSAAG
jgi:acetoin utilization protein AcuB